MEERRNAAQVRGTGKERIFGPKAYTAAKRQSVHKKDRQIHSPSI